MEWDLYNRKLFICKANMVPANDGLCAVAAQSWAATYVNHFFAKKCT
jgi:hypothetical protein